MEAIVNKQPDSLDYHFFTTKKDEVPFWDHPFLKGSKVLPSKYYPYTTIQGVLSHYQRGLIDKTDFIMLKVIGDSICASEDQIRRYMSSLITRSDTSKRLDRLRTNGLVERWKVRIRGQEDTVKPAAPFTLGIAGYKLLKHFYNADFFMDPNRWDDLGIGAIKRYVAMNELRCLMVEQKIVNKWKWNAILADNHRIKFPMAAAEMKTPQGNVNFLIDRAQMNQNFVGYFKDKLYTWKKVHEKYGNLPVSEFPSQVGFAVIFTSTLTVAEHLHKELLLDTYPFTIFLCVEEDLLLEGFETSFYRPIKQSLKRIKLEF